jgi:hypothetical protein
MKRYQNLGRRSSTVKRRQALILNLYQHFGNGCFSHREAYAIEGRRLDGDLHHLQQIKLLRGMQSPTNADRKIYFLLPNGETIARLLSSLLDAYGLVMVMARENNEIKRRLTRKGCRIRKANARTKEPSLL